MSSGGCVRCAGKLGGRRREQSLLPIAAISLRNAHTTAATLARRSARPPHYGHALDQEARVSGPARLTL